MWNVLLDQLHRTPIHSFHMDHIKVWVDNTVLMWVAAFCAVLGAFSMARFLLSVFTTFLQVHVLPGLQVPFLFLLPCYLCV